MIQTFGTADKLVLSVLVLVVIAVIAAITARWETRRVPIGSAAIVLAGVAGCAAVLSRAGATPVDIVPTVVGTVCGVLVLRLLTSGRFTDEPDARPHDSDAPRSRSAGIAGDAWTAQRGRAHRRDRRRAVAATDIGERDRDAFTLPKVDVGRRADSADGAAQRCCAAVVHHQQ